MIIGFGVYYFSGKPMTNGDVISKRNSRVYGIFMGI
jgi:hypothetical protein